MSALFLLTLDAAAQLAQILDHITAENEGAARRLKDALLSAIRHPADTPEMGHWREDLTARHVKFWSVYHYLVVYDPASSPLIVLAILHGARDVEQLLKEP